MLDFLNNNSSGISALALVITAAWVIYRFQKERDHYLHIEFRMGCKFFGPEMDKYLCEFKLSFENKGKVRHEIKEKDLKIRIRGLKNGSEFNLRTSGKSKLSVEFPEEVLPETLVIPDGYIFIEPGVCQDVNFQFPVSCDIKYMLAFAQFSYGPYTPHTAERVFKVLESTN